MSCIRSKEYILVSLLANSNSMNWFHLGFDGLQQYAKDIPYDFILMFYSKKWTR